MTQRTLPVIIQNLNAMIGPKQDEIDSFREKLAKNAEYAFRWADGAMKAAAEVAVYKRVVAVAEAMLHEGQTVEQLRSFVIEEAWSATRSLTSQSTSACTNDMHRHAAVAYAELLSGFYRIFDNA